MIAGYLKKKISEMRNRSKAIKEQLQPRKKFSFKSRRAAKKKKDKEKKKQTALLGLKTVRMKVMS